MIHMTYSPYIHMRLLSQKFFFGHLILPLSAAKAGLLPF